MSQPVTDQRVVAAFDHHSSDIAADPYPAYQQLREQCPVAWSEHHGGFWVLSSYADVFAATEDDDTFRSAPSIALPPPQYGIRNLPIDTDAPETQQLRKVLLGAYSPAAAKRMEPEVRELATSLLDAVAGSGRIDFVQDYSTPLPARVILGILGFPAADWEFFTHRVHTITHGITRDPEGTTQAALELAGAIWTQMEDRRTRGYGDDQLSMIMQARVDGELLSDQDVVSFAMLILFGGLDTTTGSLANTLVLLERDPSLRDRLVRHPEDIPKAIEEFLRYWSPVQGLGRTVSQDTVVGSQCLRAGERALLLWASANRDPAEFPEPDRVDIDRSPNRHLAFGVGLHRCLGSNLGRLMFRVMLEEVLARIPDYRLDPDPEQYRYEDAANVYALTHLPATFTPRARA
jgi:cytochrome P450